MSKQQNETARRPNVVVVLADDMGFSDIGCYGGEIETPTLDGLAARGVRMSQFYNTARCSPSRASLLTGLHPHQTGIGILVDDDGPNGYPGTLNDRCVTMAEVLGAAGYATYLSGKWHLVGDRWTPNSAWPTRRGFDRFYGTLLGGGSFWNPATLTRDETPIEESELPADFYYTDAISDAAAEFVTDHDRADPFFLYVAYTAPHWPLHAREEDIAACRGRYDVGWDELRHRRAKRLADEGILDAEWALSDRDPDVPAWDEVTEREWETRRMEVYAAQVESMDRGIGRIVDALRATGQLENTLFMFLSDNGGCAEGQPLGYVKEGAGLATTHTRDGRRVFRGNTPEVMPGPEKTYASYGRAWANLSNTPFREYKHWVHEGGIATPLVVHWPAGLSGVGGEGDAGGAGGGDAGTTPVGGLVRHAPHQLPDIMATVLDATGVEYPASFPGRDLLPLEGRSMLPAWRGEEAAGSDIGEHTGAEHALFWEHEGNAAVRRGRWKLVRKYPGDWELYDMVDDRTELHDRAGHQPDVVAELAGTYDQWAKRCGVLPRADVLALYERRAKQIPSWETK